MKKKVLGILVTSAIRYHVNGMRFRQEKNHHRSSRCRG